MSEGQYAVLLLGLVFLSPAVVFFLAVVFAIRSDIKIRDLYVRDEREEEIDG